jgi:hypothetical protein
MEISRHVSPVSLLEVSTEYFQRALVDELGMIRTHMGTHKRSETVAVLGTPFEIPSSNSNSRGGTF